ncbi:uncharacterized protein LOC121838498 [Ixodes scapularis]|uniref:uncharacterized protein LOC121838498 n=1 Tax=Ixodes scapularis TaxID=6945 RepID=UPI001C391DF4|nr:uncharacterized protein LOC121838498 [Ixodes scapularis]
MWYQGMHNALSYLGLVNLLLLNLLKENMLKHLEAKKNKNQMEHKKSRKLSQTLQDLKVRCDFSYFSDGMTVCEARRLHESKLCLEGGGPVLLVNGALNPTTRTAQHWHSVWSTTCFGGGAIAPLSKLEEKATLYAAQGTGVTVSRSDSSTCWAVLVVTPIMQRAQALDVAKDIVFIHSTSSCYTTRCTVSVVLVATMAGTVPVAGLVHNEQSTEGYLTAFKLLRDSHPLWFEAHPFIFVIVAEQ